MEPSLKDIENPPKPTKGEVDFLMAEYAALRTEIENHLQDRKKLDGQVITGVVASYVWIFTRPDDSNFDLIESSLFIPPALCLFGFLKWLGIMAKMFSAADYIVKIERSLLRTDFFGWEHFLQRRRISRPIAGRIEGSVESLFWLCIIVATTVLSIYTASKI